jgi:hypothetical protein
MMSACHTALSRLNEAGRRVLSEKFSYETGEMDLGGGGGGERDGADRSSQRERRDTRTGSVASAGRERKIFGCDETSMK